MKKIMTFITAAVLICALLGMSAFAAEAPAQPADPSNPSAVAPSAQPAAPQDPAATSAAPAASAPAVTPTVFETPDGILSITMPMNEGTWTVVQDPDAWFAVSNGTDKITIQHLANGDPLPEVKIADEEYAQIFQIFYSTENEIFVVTGYAKDAQRMPAVRNAVCSFKVLKFDTLQKKEEEAPKPPEVREVQETLYCNQTAGVNVRSGPDTSYDILGGVHYGDTISVTGYVTENGYDTGWLRINFNGMTGYVHGSNFSKNQPPARTGYSFDLYAPEGGGVVVTVYELTDGRYMDSSNHFYTQASDTEFFDESDNKWVLPAYFDDNPVGQIFTDFYQDMIVEATGEPITVRLMTQGDYIDEATGVIYKMEGGGGPHMYGDDGSVLVFPDEYYGEWD